MLRSYWLSITLLLLLQVFCSACSISKKWICSEPDFSKNTVIINGNSVEIDLQIVNDLGEDEVKHYSFDVVENLQHPSDETLSILILKDTQNQQYCILPQMEIDTTTCKFLPYETMVQLAELNSLKKELNQDLQTRDPKTGETITVPSYFGFFGLVKVKGQLFELKS